MPITPNAVVTFSNTITNEVAGKQFNGAFATNSPFVKGSFNNYTDAATVGIDFGTGSQEYINAVLYFSKAGNSGSLPNGLGFFPMNKQGFGLAFLNGTAADTDLVALNTAFGAGTFAVIIDGVTGGTTATAFFATTYAGFISGLAAKLQTAIQKVATTGYSTATVTNVNSNTTRYAFLVGNTVLTNNYNTKSNFTINLVFPADLSAANLVSLQKVFGDATINKNVATGSYSILVKYQQPFYTNVSDYVSNAYKTNINWQTFALVSQLKIGVANTGLSQNDVVSLCTIVDIGDGGNIKPYNLVFSYQDSFTNINSLLSLVSSKTGKALIYAGDPARSNAYNAEIGYMVEIATNGFGYTQTVGLMTSILMDGFAPSIDANGNEFDDNAAATADLAKVNYVGRFIEGGNTFVNRLRFGYCGGGADEPQDINTYVNVCWLQYNLASALNNVLNNSDVSTFNTGPILDELTKVMNTARALTIVVPLDSATLAASKSKLLQFSNNDVQVTINLSGQNQGWWIGPITTTYVNNKYVANIKIASGFSKAYRLFNIVSNQF